MRQQAFDQAKLDAFLGQMLSDLGGAMSVALVRMGESLGLYKALDQLGSATSAQLADATGTDERYIREWLEQQAATGILDAENPEAEATARRFRLPAGHREVLLEQQSLNYMAALLRLVIGAASPLPAVIQAYRDGSGIPYAAYGADTIEGIAEMNRPLFLNQLGTEWLPAIPDVHARLQADPPAWLQELRRNGPHPRPVVAAKLGVSIAGLARAGVTEALTTEQIEALKDESPEWLQRERATQAEVRKEGARIKKRNAERAAERP